MGTVLIDLNGQNNPEREKEGETGDTMLTRTARNRIKANPINVTQQTEGVLETGVAG